jgi:UTP-glucose-1-phosphate uridylyltransferase
MSPDPVAPTLVVLAAGMGSRYGGLKQLDPVGPLGEIILDYSVRDALAAGFGKVVFVIRREMAELFREAVGVRYEGIIEVAYAFQELEPLPGGRVSTPGRTKPWGTGQAVLSAASVVREPFAVINADDYYGPSGFQALSGFLSDKTEGHYAMVGYRLDRTLSENGTVSRGICSVDGEGRLLEITERTSIARRADRVIEAEGNPLLALTGEEPVSMNFWGFTPDLFAKLERLFQEFLEERGEDLKAEFYLPAAVSSLIAAGEVMVTMLGTPDAWYGLTYPEDKPAVVEALASL